MRRGGGVGLGVADSTSVLFVCVLVPIGRLPIECTKKETLTALAALDTFAACPSPAHNRRRMRTPAPTCKTSKRSRCPFHAFPVAWLILLGVGPIPAHAARTHAQHGRGQGHDRILSTASPIDT